MSTYDDHIARFSDSKHYEIPGGECWLYADCPTGRLSCALVEERGRYPETGFKKNLTCTEAIFVAEGELTVWIEDEEIHLDQYDVLYVPVGKRYAVYGDRGKSFIFIEPKWDKSQNVEA